jgi:hypothetical protein
MFVRITFSTILALFSVFAIAQSEQEIRSCSLVKGEQVSMLACPEGSALYHINGTPVCRPPASVLPATPRGEVPVRKDANGQCVLPKT